jgi:ribosomal protein S18 acetylase RimI-like enzyme
MVVRGTAEDVASLCALWRQMVEHHREIVAGELPVRPSAEAWAVRREEYLGWLADGSGLLYLAPGEDAPRGYLFCRLVPSGSTFDLGPVRGEIESLSVGIDARGGGIGTALLTACREELLRRGCTYWTVGVVAANAGAARLYARAGFRPWVLEMAAPL